MLSLLLALHSALVVQQTADFAITHVTVINVADGSRLPDRTVTIRGDRIIGVSPTTNAVPSAATRVIDGARKFLIPGLWDMHVHTIAWERNDLRQFLRNGVTGVRDLGGVPDSINALTRDIAAGRLAGPRIVMAGRTLDRGGERNPSNIAAVRTAAEAREAVRANAATGARVIKVWSNIPREAFFAAADEARRLGLPLTGHPPIWVDLVSAIQAGQHGIEHTISLALAFSRDGAAIQKLLQDRVAGATNSGEVFTALIAADLEALASPDEAAMARVLQLMAKERVWVCPTLTDSRAYAVMRDSLAGDPRFQFFPPGLRQRWIGEMNGMSETDVSGLTRLFPAALRIVGRLHQAGVGLLAGTEPAHSTICPASTSTTSWR